MPLIGRGTRSASRRPRRRRPQPATGALHGRRGHASPTCATAMEQGRTTSRDIVQQYLDRIATLRRPAQRRDHREPARARGGRRARPRARAPARVRGPLHGIPIALKDNIHTTDMPTTGGALAFAGLVPPYEATLTKNLRDAGAVIIAKTVLTELANWVAAGMPTNYNVARRLRLQPVRSAARSRAPATADGRPVLPHRRLQLRHRHRGELLGRQRRHRNVGLDPQPGEPEHARRHQADGRPHQPLRRDSDHRRSGHAGPDGAYRDRRGDPARRARGRAPDPQRSGARAPARRRRAATTRRSCSPTP